MARKRRRNFEQPALETFLEDIENDSDEMEAAANDEMDKELDSINDIESDEGEDELDAPVDEPEVDVDADIDVDIEDPVDAVADDEEPVEEAASESTGLGALFPTKERVMVVINSISNAINSQNMPSAVQSTEVKRKVISELLNSFSNTLGVDFAKIGPTQQIITDIDDGKYSQSGDEPVADEPVADEPVADEPVADEPEEEPVEVSADDAEDFEDVDKEIDSE